MDDSIKTAEMQELISRLHEASDAYYNGKEIMDNFEYDSLFDRLTALEKETGIVLENSPTQSVGASAVDALPKITHEYPALSLAKTKDTDSYVGKFSQYISEPAHLSDSRNTRNVCIEWKMDGSTVVATYDGGSLTTLATRGNGSEGSVITHNAPYINGLPQKIPYTGHLVVRGEAVMSYAEFDRINAGITDEDSKYKNPRNLANSTISLLDSAEMRTRRIDFHAFTLVHREDGIPEQFHAQLDYLGSLGFNTVQREVVDVDMLADTMQAWSDRVSAYGYPVDGLVCVLDDWWYTKDLPGTGHNPHIMQGYAFKWQDETAETYLRSIEWNTSRTGILAPVAVFDAVELEGTTVTRATLHNVSEIKRILGKPYTGQKIHVYKANKIIPIVLDGEPSSNVRDMDMLRMPTHCPVCGKAACLDTSTSGTEVLRCISSDCPAKKTGALVHFCERDCMDINGMSEETVSKFVSAGIIRDFIDFFRLGDHPEIASMEGFGQKSYDNMLAASEKARTTDFVSFIHALGIPNIGKGQAKLLKKYLEENYDSLAGQVPGMLAQSYSLIGLYTGLIRNGKRIIWSEAIQGFGPVLSDSLDAWNTVNIACSDWVVQLVSVLAFTDSRAEKKAEPLAGKTFVITGDVHHFRNRAELQARIEELGGKCSGSVSSKTSYLINNDVTSTSGKNKKAMELGIPVISEDDFLKMA